MDEMVPIFRQSDGRPILRVSLHWTSPISHWWIKWLTHGAYQLVVSEKPGKTWKNQGDLTTTQKILRNLQAVHDVDQLLAKKKHPAPPWAGHSLWPWLKIGGTGCSFTKHRGGKGFCTVSLRYLCDFNQLIICSHTGVHSTIVDDSANGVLSRCTATPECILSLITKFSLYGSVLGNLATREVGNFDGLMISSVFITVAGRVVL